MKLLMIALCAAVLLVGCTPKEEPKPEGLIESTLTKVDETQKAVSKDVSTAIDKAKTDTAVQKEAVTEKADEATE